MKIKDIQHGSPYFYHVSHCFYEQPSLYEIDKRYDVYHSRNPNGVIGLWLSPYSDGYEMFGDYRYLVQLDKNLKVGILPFNELMKMNRSNNPQIKEFSSCVEFYKDYRSQQGQKYDILCVMSAHNELAELIVLNFNIISSFELYHHTNQKKYML